MPSLYRGSAVFFSREDVAAPGHLFDVFVLGDYPEATVVEAAPADRLFVPPDRCGAAHLGELLDGQALGVDVGIGEVESWWEVRCRH